MYRRQLEPATPGQLQRTRALIRQLDDDDYAAREAATEAIAQVGMAAEPRIRARRRRKRVISPEPIAKLTGHHGDLEIVCFSPDDKLLATGCRGGDVEVWSVPDFQEIATLTAPSAE